MTHARQEDGFALIEVIVSAAILAVIALAVLSGLDGAGQASARERARSQASALAEQDQERLRTMVSNGVSDLVGNVPQTGTVQVGDDKASYTVKSEVFFNTDDDGGAPACGDKDYRATEYARLVTTVTSNIVGVRMNPVRIESLKATRAGDAASTGSLTVRVQPAQADKVARTANLAVTISGPQGDTQPTNSAGCALFRSIQIGNYKITLNTPGYVDKLGDQSPETTATVNPGARHARVVHLRQGREHERRHQDDQAGRDVLDDRAEPAVEGGLRGRQRRRPGHAARLRAEPRRLDVHHQAADAVPVRGVVLASSRAPARTRARPKRPRRSTRTTSTRSTRPRPCSVTRAPSSRRARRSTSRR